MKGKLKARFLDKLAMKKPEPKVLPFSFKKEKLVKELPKHLLPFKNWEKTITELIPEGAFAAIELMDYYNLINEVNAEQFPHK